MKKGDRISYQGQPGVIVEDTRVTPGMLDVKLDHERFVRRASPSQLARLNAGNGGEKEDPVLFPMGISPEGQALVRPQKGKPVTRKARKEKELSQEERIEKVYKEAEGYAEKVGFRLPSLEDLEERYLGVLPSAEAYNTLEKKVEGYRRRLKTRAEKDAEAERVAKMFKPASGRIRGLLQHGEARVKTPLDRPGAGVFTRPDPPRRAKDGSFCGNFIDGTAYYMAVSDLSRPDTRFVSWEELYRAAKEDGYILGDLDEYVDTVALLKLESLGKRLRSSVLYGEATGTESLRGEQEYGLFTRYLNSIRDLSFPYAERPVPYKNYLQILTDMVNAGWQTDGTQVAGLYVRRQGEGPWELVPAPQIEGTRDVYLNRGDEIRIVVPKPQFLQMLSDYFNLQYAPTRRRRGYQFFTRKESLSPRGSTQAVRGKKGKKARRTAIDEKVVGRGPTRELVVTRARRGPAAEELADTKKKNLGGYQAKPGVTFAQLEDSGKLGYWVQKRTVAPGQDKQRAFLPYGGQTRGSRLRWKNTYREEMPAIKALVRLSAKQPPAVSPEVAQLLFASDLVTLEYREEGDKYTRQVLLSDPNELVREGDVLSVWDEKKAQSPYFSWTREMVTDKLESGDVGPCLTASEQEALEFLTKFRNRILSLRSQLGSIRRIFQNLRVDRGNTSMGRNKNIGQLLKRLGYSIASLSDARLELETALKKPEKSRLGADGTDIAVKALSAAGEETESPFNLFDYNSRTEKYSEAPSLLNALLDAADEGGLGIIQIVEGYAENQLSEEGGQQILMKRLQDSFLQEDIEQPELGATGVRFLRGEEEAPVPTSMGLALASFFEKAGREPPPGVSEIHPLDDFYDWSLRVTLGFAGHEMPLNERGRSLPAQDVLTYLRAGSDLSGLTSASSVREMRLDSKRNNEKLAGIRWGEIIRGFAIGGQKPARRRDKGPPVITQGDLVFPPSAQQWLAMSAQRGVFHRLGPARLRKGTASARRSVAALSDANQPRPHAQTGTPVVIDLEEYEDDSMGRGLAGLPLDERLDRNDTYTYLLSDLFNERIGTDPSDDREAEVLRLRRRGRVYRGRDDRILELLLLAHLYYLLDGYALAGALGAAAYRGEEAEMSRGLGLLNKQIQSISGGSPLGGTKRETFTVWKTYNPVLFEMARLYWPTTSASEPRFKSILAQEQVFKDVDAVGRYGQAARTLAPVLMDREEDPGQLMDELYVGNPLRQLYHLLVNRAQEPDVFVKAVRTSGWLQSERLGVPEVLDMAQAQGLSQGRLNNALDLTDYLWAVGLTYEQAAAAVVKWAKDPVSGVRKFKLRAAQAFPKLLAHREAGLPPEIPESLFSDKGARNAIKSGTPVETLEGDTPTLALLRRALAKAVYMKHGKRVRIGPGNERKWLADFTKAPPNIRIRKGRSIQSVRLNQMRSLDLNQFVYYEPDVIKNLALIEASIEAPPGERVDQEGVNNVPWLLRERASPSRVGGKTVFVGQPDIWGESVLVQAESEGEDYRSLLSSLDKLITKIERSL